MGYNTLVKQSYLKTIMKNAIIVKVPENYSEEQKKELKNSIERAIDTTGVILVPESVEIYSLPFNF
jgi:hypothetical protein